MNEYLARLKALKFGDPPGSDTFKTLKSPANPPFEAFDGSDPKVSAKNFHAVEAPSKPSKPCGQSRSRIPFEGYEGAPPNGCSEEKQPSNLPSKPSKAALGHVTEPPALTIDQVAERIEGWLRITDNPPRNCTKAWKDLADATEAFALGAGPTRRSWLAGATARYSPSMRASFRSSCAARSISWPSMNKKPRS
jgi:hypothetical protein